MKNIVKLTTITGTALLLAGCISHQETVHRDVPRQAVEFENETAARIFYETLSKPPVRAARSESSTKVALPIVFEHERKVVTGPNIAFNAAVEQCDTNGDGRITELEARIFSEQREKK